MTKGALTGSHFFYGNYACAEGAIAAGCRFFAGYPITPSTEIAERMSQRLPEVDGTYIQMEDEIASITAILGASAAGAKAMTATSGPGFSLMMEGLGLGIMHELPCVIVNVQRGGPSTGLPTLVGQQDMMQARWGSHGDYAIIAYSPSSPQEFFDITITAFNSAEKYRCPVLVMADEVVGHMREKVTIPPEDALRTGRVERKYAPDGEMDFAPFRPGKDLVPDFSPPGTGRALRMTGLTHDEYGKAAINPAAQDKLVRRLKEKIESHMDDIAKYEAYKLDDAEVAVITYGITARCAREVIDHLRRDGVRIGMLRLVSVWPFPDDVIRKVLSKVRTAIVPEINLGQIVHEVERCARNGTKVVPVNYAGGRLPPYDEFSTSIRGAAQ